MFPLQQGADLPPGPVVQLPGLGEGFLRPHLPVHNDLGRAGHGLVVSLHQPLLLLVKGGFPVRQSLIVPEFVQDLRPCVPLQNVPVGGVRQQAQCPVALVKELDGQLGEGGGLVCGSLVRPVGVIADADQSGLGGQLVHLR